LRLSTNSLDPFASFTEYVGKLLSSLEGSTGLSGTSLSLLSIAPMQLQLNGHFVLTSSSSGSAKRTQKKAQDPLFASLRSISPLVHLEGAHYNPSPNWSPRFRARAAKVVENDIQTDSQSGPVIFVSHPRTPQGCLVPSTARFCCSPLLLAFNMPTQSLRIESFVLAYFPI